LPLKVGGHVPPSSYGSAAHVKFNPKFSTRRFHPESNH